MTDSHSALFGLAGQKGPSSTAGSGADSGIIGTSGHTGAAKRTTNDDPAATAAGKSTTAGIPHEGKSNTIPGSGGDTLKPSQGTGDIKPH